MLDCAKCRDKCKSACCGIVPIPEKIYKAHPRVRKVIEEVEFHGNIIAKTEDNYCPFLSPSGECTIYEYRSDLCRKFGDESCILMTCQWQDKDGRLRGRPERKRIGLAIMEKYKLMILDR